MGTRAQNLGSSLEETIWRSWKHGPPSAKAEHQNSFRRISDGIIAKTANWPGVRNTPLWTMYIGLLLKWQWSPRVTSNFRNEHKLGANQNFLYVDLLLGALNGRGDTVHNASQESQCVWCEILARTVEVKEATAFKSVDDTREAPFHTGNQLEPKWLRLRINNVINHHNLFTRTPRKYHHD